MKLVQPPEWYESTLRDVNSVAVGAFTESEECGAGLPTNVVQCIHCEKKMEDDGTESPICDECWEEMWEEREKENKKVEDNYYDYSLIMKGIRNGS